MNDVRIVFTASQSWFGRLIRWFTKSTVSHVFLQFPVWGRSCVIESTVGGTRLVLATKARHDVVQEYTFKEQVTKEQLLALMQHLGTPYDYAGILVLAWVRIVWNWFRLKVTHPSWSSKALKCSELVFLFFGDIGVHMHTTRELASPEDLLQACEQNTTVFAHFVSGHVN